MNGYICFYKGKRFEVAAPTSYAAQKLCAEQNRIKKSYGLTMSATVISFLLGVIVERLQDIRKILETHHD